jgi:hypothetical protein
VGEETIKRGHVINSQELLFSKIEDSQIENQHNKLKATKNNNELKPVPLLKSVVNFQKI